MYMLPCEYVYTTQAWCPIDAFPHANPLPTPPICCQTYYHTGCIGGPQYNSYTHLHPLLDTCRESNLHLWKSQKKYFKISGPWKEGRSVLLRRQEIYNVFKNLRYYAIRLTVIAMLFFSLTSLLLVEILCLEKKSFYFQFGPNGIFYLSQLCWCKAFVQAFEDVFVCSVRRCKWFTPQLWHFPPKLSCWFIVETFSHKYSTVPVNRNV